MTSPRRGTASLRVAPGSARSSGSIRPGSPPGLPGRCATSIPATCWIGRTCDGLTATSSSGSSWRGRGLAPPRCRGGGGGVETASGPLGPNFAIVSACATGAHAIGEAWETIRRGDADMMLAGGAEATIHEAVVGGFASMKALSTRNDDPAGASRPFDQGRDGFVMGEGAGILVLEALEHAAARGAIPLAELVGYGATADASHITLPAPGGIGAVRAARRALQKAGIEASEVDHVTAQPTSTPEGDRAELQGLRTIFGDHAPKVAVTANKSMLGHTLGAAGALESIAVIQALRTGTVPPTINLDRPDPAAEGLDLTPNRATRRELRIWLQNSFALCGQDGAPTF